MRNLSNGIGIDMRRGMDYIHDDRYDGTDTEVYNRGVSLTNINFEIMKFLWLHLDHNFKTRVRVMGSYNRMDYEYSLTVENEILGYNQQFNLTISDQETMRRELREYSSMLERDITYKFISLFEETGRTFQEVIHNKTAILHIESKDQLLAVLCKRLVNEQMGNQKPRTR